MNNDLISRSELKKAIETCDKFACLPDTKLMPFHKLNEPEKNYEPYVHLRDIKNAIDNTPTVKTYCYFCGQTEHGQVVPDTLQGWKYEERPQGEWNYIQADMCVCPFCGAYPHKDYKNFCPNCGAELKGGEEC